MTRSIAVTGASGKTGWRVVQEALARGWQTRALLRPSSQVPEGLKGSDIRRLQFSDQKALVQALEGCDALVIACGARPSPDLSGPLKVDALALRPQIEACRRAGVKRIVLVTSLCSGRLLHPLNLFGLILVWKGLGERWLRESGLDWTIIRPGGLSEREEDLEALRLVFTDADRQEDGTIPRRLVARVCLDALETPASVGRVLEITAAPEAPPVCLAQWLQNQPLTPAAPG
ncbi:MAG: SDR family oxidoreductase [Synechococcaceae cyanobacterium]|nr:SDR family oxidoreductase [Synechococcaceae cyanobacterium]